VVLYGLTGAVALGLEVVFFRVIGVILRPNSYTFGHVLTLYLVFFAIGTAVGSRLVRRARLPERWFLTLQFIVGVTALGGLWGLLKIPAALGIDGSLRRYFSGTGFFNLILTRHDLPLFVFAYLAVPLVIMGPPVFLMGASFPFVQAVVSDRIDRLGRRTGLLLTSNIVGNVVGTLVTGFVLIRHLGSSGTLKLLAGLLLAIGVGVAFTQTTTRRVLAIAATIALMAASIGFFPANRSIWRYVHGASAIPFAVVEDQACVDALKTSVGVTTLSINGNDQNSYPFDDFHVLIGLTPALLHPRPMRALAVGLGMGSTAYGVVVDRRVTRVDSVEICGGEMPLLRNFARRHSSPEISRLFNDKRVLMHAGDGRKFLLGSRERFDVVAVDTLLPQSAYSGALYSVEFYELIRSRLAAGGLVAQWAPTQRALNSIKSVFPHMLIFAVPQYAYGLEFVVGSDTPIRFDRSVIMSRLAAAGPEQGLPNQAASIRDYFAKTRPQALDSVTAVPDTQRTLDLHPRDEYFLNQPTEYVSSSQ
jgi:spermidine synthase